jgi:hypothetical protein
MSKDTKKYVVDYKEVNEVLKKKKAELEELLTKVDAVGKIDINLQLTAMDLLIKKCKAGKMTSTYDGA